jgi:hypothetical protein
MLIAGCAETHKGTLPYQQEGWGEHSQGHTRHAVQLQCSREHSRSLAVILIWLKCSSTSTASMFPVSACLEGSAETGQQHGPVWQPGQKQCEPVSTTQLCSKECEEPNTRIFGARNKPPTLGLSYGSMPGHHGWQHPTTPQPYKPLW